MGFEWGMVNLTYFFSPVRVAAARVKRPRAWGRRVVGLCKVWPRKGMQRIAVLDVLQIRLFGVCVDNNIDFCLKRVFCFAKNH